VSTLYLGVSAEMGVVFALVLAALALFATEPVPVDVTAIGVMVALLLVDPVTEALTGDSETRQLGATIGIVSPLSGFVNNTAAVAVLLPMVIPSDLVRTVRKPPAALPPAMLESCPSSRARKLPAAGRRVPVGPPCCDNTARGRATQASEANEDRSESRESSPGGFLAGGGTRSAEGNSCQDRVVGNPHHWRRSVGLM